MAQSAMQLDYMIICEMPHPGDPPADPFPSDPVPTEVPPNEPTIPTMPSPIGA